MRTRIKICGITRPEDALAAAKLGVDAIGLVFYPPSPRYVEISQAIEIVASLPAFVSVVALFVDADENFISQVIAKMPIDCLQFHGEETAEACRLYGKRYIKAHRVKEGSDLQAVSRHYPDADGLLLDAYQAGAKGGTGEQFDWALVPKQCDLPIILAGGLDAANAKLAVATVRPYALDVSSGVEASKGIKDKDKMAAFVAAVSQSDKVR